MQSKNKPAMDAQERQWVALVRSLPCSVCDAPGPSHAHEPEQGLWFCAVALCPDCHQGSINGWHGQRRIWKVKKMDELAALAITVRRAVLMLTQSTPSRQEPEDGF